MKILYLSHCTGYNGSTIALLNIVKEMVNKGHRVGLIIPEKDNFLYTGAISFGVEIFSSFTYPMIMEMPDFNCGIVKRIKRTVKVFLLILGMVKAYIYVFIIISKYKPDIVHTNTSAVDYAFQICRLKRIPHVWHIREVFSIGNKKEHFPSENYFHRCLMNPINFNIAITKAVHEEIGLRNNDPIIYDGVISSQSCHEIKPAKFDYPYFLSVGYCTPAKGYLELIEQFCIFAKRNFSHHLLLAGWFAMDASYCRKCYAVAEKAGLIDRIHFLGNRTDIYELMSAATALIVASPFEGFGFTMVEAMFNRTLVIGRNTGGIKEQFNRGRIQSGIEIGLRFTDDKELPELLNKAIKEDYTTVKEKAYEVVCSNYTTKINADRINYLYERILRNK